MQCEVLALAFLFNIDQVKQLFNIDQVKQISNFKASNASKQVTQHSHMRQYVA